MNIENSPRPVTIWPQRENAGMNIKPIAWMYSSRYTGGRWFLTRCQTDLSTYKAERMVPLYLPSAIYELQRQLAEVRSWSATEAAANVASVGEYIAQIERQLAEREAVIVQLREALDRIYKHAAYRGENDPRDTAIGQLLFIEDECKNVSIPTDHTALDELLEPMRKDTKRIDFWCSLNAKERESLRDDYNLYDGMPSDNFRAAIDAAMVRRMADEIRRKT